MKKKKNKYEESTTNDKNDNHNMDMHIDYRLPKLLRKKKTRLVNGSIQLVSQSVS